jgi:hypothetical protein
MKNIAKAFPSIENQQSFIQNISKTLGKNVKSLDNKSLALVTARILDTFYPAQDNRNNNMLKSFSFGDYSNQREKVLKYNETVAIKRINNYFEKQKNLQASGWNPTKTAELLKNRDTYNVGGIVLRKVMQLKAAGKDVEYDPSAAQKTQIATTGGTYEKASKIMDDYNAYDSLDYGSGIQINQARQVLKADTYEPYPQLDKADKYGTPDFVEPEEITRKYNFITNFSVLNVLPKLDRDKAVKHIGSLLQDNGVAVITVRSKDDVLKALPNAKKQLSDSELITARGTYQKGFTRDELKKYLSETLGKDYEVMDLPNKYKMSGVGVLIKKSPRSKFSEGGPVSAAENILQTEAKKRGWTPEQTNLFRQFADDVGWVEADSIPTRTQNDDPKGIGRGKYQVEMDSLRREATKNNPEQYKRYKDLTGSSSVYVNRYKNYKAKNNLPLTKEEIELFKNKDLDFSRIPEDLQDAMFYTDKLQKPNFAVDDLVTGKISPNDAWYKYHYAGKDESKRNLFNERLAKRSQ